VPSPFTSVAYTDHAPSALAVMSCSVKPGLDVSPLFRNSRTLSSSSEATKMSTVPSPFTSVAYTDFAPSALEVMSCSVNAQANGKHSTRMAATTRSFANALNMVIVGD